MDSFSIENLTSYLDKMKFKINEIYSINGSCAFIKTLCVDTGDELVISIPFKYPMKVINKTIELVKFTDTDTDNIFVSSNDNKEVFNEIKIPEMEDDRLYLDPLEADRLLEQYQEIDIDSESCDVLKYNIISYKRQLDRLKVCTNSIKYKLCIITPSGFCTVTRKNNIKCFAVKKGKPTINENKDLCIVIDLENFYDKIDKIHTDTNKVYKHLYDIMGRAHNNQTSIVSARIRQYQNVSKNLIDKYKKKESYETSIGVINSVMARIKKRENDIIRKIESSKREKSGGLISSASKSFTVKRLEEDYDKLLQFKDDSIKLLTDTKTDYNNFILDFDYALSDTIRLFNQVTSNFVKIGVVTECKKII